MCSKRGQVARDCQHQSITFRIESHCSPMLHQQPPIEKDRWTAEETIHLFSGTGSLGMDTFLITAAPPLPLQMLHLFSPLPFPARQQNWKYIGSN